MNKKVLHYVLTSNLNNTKYLCCLPYLFCDLPTRPPDIHHFYNYIVVKFQHKLKKNSLPRQKKNKIEFQHLQKYFQLTSYLIHFVHPIFHALPKNKISPPNFTVALSHRTGTTIRVKQRLISSNRGARCVEPRCLNFQISCRCS